jgi:hypothetical protein
METARFACSAFYSGKPGALAEGNTQKTFQRGLELADVGRIFLIRRNLEEIAMRRRIPTCLAIGFMLATAHQAAAQEIVAPPVPTVPVANGYTMPYQRGCSPKRIFQWLTYRPLPVPVCCQCLRCQTTGTPPLYMYFIAEYGPRSPNLAHLTGGHAAGQVFQGPSLFEPAGNAHIYAAADSRSAPHIKKSLFGPPPLFEPAGNAHVDAAADSRPDPRVKKSLFGSPRVMNTVGRGGVAPGEGWHRQAVQQAPVWDAPARLPGREANVAVRDVPAAASGQAIPAAQEIPFHAPGSGEEQILKEE